MFITMTTTTLAMVTITTITERLGGGTIILDNWDGSSCLFL